MRERDIEFQLCVGGTFDPAEFKKEGEEGFFEMYMGETAGDCSKNRIPAGTHRVGDFRLFKVFFFEGIWEGEGGVTQDYGAAVDDVEGFSLPEGETGCVADSADFSAVGVFSSGAVSEVFEHEKTVFFLDFFKFYHVNRDSEGILDDKNLDFFVFFQERFEGFWGVVGGEFFYFGEDGNETGFLDSFDDCFAGEAVNEDVVAVFDLFRGFHSFKSEENCGSAGINDRSPVESVSIGA